MSRVEQAPLPLNHDQITLRAALDARYMEYRLLRDSTKSSDITNNTGMKDRTARLIFAPVFAKIEQSRYEVMFLSHALSQAGDRDNEIADDQAFIEEIHACEERTAMLDASRDFTSSSYAFQVRDFHLMLDLLRTSEGERVASPYGKDFAHQAATGRVVLSQRERS